MLTDEQIDAAWNFSTGGNFVTEDMRAFARAIIEAAAPEIRRVEREMCADMVRYFHTDQPGNAARLVNGSLTIVERAIRSLPDAG